MQGYREKQGRPLVHTWGRISAHEVGNKGNKSKLNGTIMQITQDPEGVPWPVGE